MNSNWTKNREFIPPWYLKSGHLQTLLTGFYKPKVFIAPDVTHKIPLGEAGEMLVHENSPVACRGESRAVFLLHGLGSCHRGTYMSRIAADLLARNVRVFRFDLPGAGESYLHTPLPPHGACYDLVWNALVHLAKKCGVSHWRGAGVSLGGNILLKLASMYSTTLATPTKSTFYLERIIAVAPPIDLSACCENMEHGFNTVYAKYFLRSLKKQTLSRAKLWPQWEKLLPGASFQSIRKFDDSVTAKLAGFANAIEYYERGSSKNDLQKINTPTLILVDEDDPIVPIGIFRDAHFSPWISIVSTQKGGHVGYLARQSESNRDEVPTHKGSRHFRWADQWIAKRLTEDSDDPRAPESK